MGKTLSAAILILLLCSCGSRNDQRIDWEEVKSFDSLNVQRQRKSDSGNVSYEFTLDVTKKMMGSSRRVYENTGYRTYTILHVHKDGEVHFWVEVNPSGQRIHTIEVDATGKEGPPLFYKDSGGEKHSVDLTSL